MFKISNLLDFEKRISRKIFNLAKHYLSKEDKILDLGSGSGWMSFYIKKTTGAKVTSIDVADISRVSDKPIIFDGKKIPFQDSSFDIVICFSVLHHTNNQEQLLKEMHRVSKSKILILEDLTENYFDKLLAFLHKLTSIIIYKSDFHKMRFRNNQGWTNLFKKTNLKIQKSIPIRRHQISLYYPIAKRLFILKKT